MNRDEVFHDFMETIYDLSRNVHTYESIPRKYGSDDQLYMVEVHTMDIIGKNKNITMSEVAEITERTKSAVSQMVNRLIKKNLVSRYRNPNNYRELFLTLTPQGETVYSYHKQLDKTEYSKLLQSMNNYTSEDFDKFTEIASVISREIQNALNERKALES